MNLIPLLVGSLSIGAALILLILIFLWTRRKPQYVMSRIFLKKDDSVKAFTLMVIGTSAFTVGRIAAVVYLFNLIPRDIFLIFQITAGEALAICLLIAFYKISKIIRPKESIKAPSSNTA